MKTASTAPTARPTSCPATRTATRAVPRFRSRTPIPLSVEGGAWVAGETVAAAAAAVMSPRARARAHVGTISGGAAASPGVVASDALNRTEPDWRTLLRQEGWYRHPDGHLVAPPALAVR